MPLPELPALLGRVRDLTQGYQAGGPASLRAFEELAVLLLSLTVKHPSAQLRLGYPRGRRDVGVLGGAAGPTDPVRLNDGNFLRVSVSLHLGDGPQGPLLKVSESSYQYQLDEAGKRWVFRYDYLRVPRGDPHPTAHLQVNGALSEAEHLPGLAEQGRLHFPTGRVGIEAVARLLVEEFGVACNRDSEIWRPVLAESERGFLGIAHQPLSGPGE